MQKGEDMFQNEIQSGQVPLHFVEADMRIRADLVNLGAALGHHSEPYTDLGELTAYPPRSGIILVRDDAQNGGIEFILDYLFNAGIWLPVIAMDFDPNPGKVVQAIKSGALDYLALPLKPERLSASLARIGKEAQNISAVRQRAIEARDRISALTVREREVLEYLTSGGSNKEIARELGISPRTVEIHRANMMSKLGARHSSDAIRIKLEANAFAMASAV